MINETLKGLNFCFAYLYSIIIYSKTEWDDLDHIRQVFDWLRTANIKLKISKCNFIKSQIHYLGHLLCQDGTTPRKIRCNQDNAPTQNIKELRQFHGWTGYYRNHINHYVDITNSLTNLLKKAEPYIWTGIHKKSFSELKTAYNHLQF